MKSSRVILTNWLRIGLLVILGTLGLFYLWKAVPANNIGHDDFVGYWSATYLLKNGQNPYDRVAMDLVQHVEIKTGLDATIMAWNPPTLFVFLLPLAWLPINTAQFILVLLNLAIVIGSSLMLARLYFPAENKYAWVFFLLFSFFFSPVITGIYMGQATFLVLLGLVGAVFLIKKKQWFWAGSILILTSIKPHLVILSLIYLIVYTAQERQYRAWAGLLFSGIICCLVLFIFRPHWIADFIGLTTIAPVHWATPTIGGLLSYWGVSEHFRYFIFLLVPLPFLLAQKRASIPLEFAIALLTLITIPLTFFGWSYDQTLLLIPIAQVFGWMAQSANKKLNLWKILAISVALIADYVQRSLNLNDVYFVWLPIFWWVVFGLIWRYSFVKGITEIQQSVETPNI